MIWPVLLTAVLPVLFENQDPAKYIKLEPPGVRYRTNMATATSAPWIDSNIWRYRQNPHALYLVNTGKKGPRLAMAEAFSQGVPAVIQTSNPSEFRKMLVFLKSVPPGPTDAWVNFTVSSDGSDMANEALLLLSRRNLLYNHGPAGIKVTKEIADPYEFMQQTRGKLTDDKRLLRLYGSELVIAALARSAERVRLHLVYYGERPFEGLRVRVKGRYAAGNVKAYTYGVTPKVVDHRVEGEFTEFSLAALDTYAVIDLN